MAAPQVELVGSDGVAIGVGGAIPVTGGTGGGGGAAYNGASSQVAQVSTFMGIAGFNGTTVDAVKTVNGGQIEVTLFTNAGAVVDVLANISGDGLTSPVNILGSAAFPLAFNGTNWDRIRNDVNKSLNVNAGAVSNTSVAGSTSFVTVKTSAGRFFGLTVQASAGGIITVTDGSGGNPIFGLASTQTSIGPTYYGVPGGNVFSTSLVVVGTASSPAVTVHFS